MVGGDGLHARRDDPDPALAEPGQHLRRSARRRAAGQDGPDAGADGVRVPGIRLRPAMRGRDRARSRRRRRRSGRSRRGCRASRRPRPRSAGGPADLGERRIEMGEVGAAASRPPRRSRCGRSPYASRVSAAPATPTRGTPEAASRATRSAVASSRGAARDEGLDDRPPASSARADLARPVDEQPAGGLPAARLRSSRAARTRGLAALVIAALVIAASAGRPVMAGVPATRRRATRTAQPVARRAPLAASSASSRASTGAPPQAELVHARGPRSRRRVQAGRVGGAGDERRPRPQERPDAGQERREVVVEAPRRAARPVAVRRRVQEDAVVATAPAHLAGHEARRVLHEPADRAVRERR